MSRSLPTTLNPAQQPSTDEIPRNRLLVGDAARLLTTLPDASVDMVLTSPPYFRLRDYGAAGQLGTGQHVDEWVTQLRTVAKQLARVLVPTGTLWLNIGDTYANHPSQGAPAKSLLLAPERLALALAADGWRLRNKIVWHKPNALPTSVRDRLATTYEVIYVFARERAYYFDLDAIRQPHQTTPKPRREVRARTGADYRRWRGPNTNGRSGIQTLKDLGRAGHPLGKNPGDVWSIATSSAGHGHPATYPERLARRAVLGGCPEARCRICRKPWTRRVVRREDGTATRQPLAPTCDCPPESEPGLVLDPFMGSGTTSVAARHLGRDSLGIELNRDFATYARQRIATAAVKKRTGITTKARKDSAA